MQESHTGENGRDRPTDATGKMSKLERDCQQFHAVLAEGRESSPIHQAFIQQHSAQCADCAEFQRRLGSLDRLAQHVEEVYPQPPDAARQRLWTSWRRLAVRKTWRDRLRSSLRRWFEPQIVRPLLPHAAMIAGFVFFTSGILALQVHTGLFTVQYTLLDRQWMSVEAPAAARSADKDIRLF